MQTDIKISPENLLEWSGMEDWVNGAAAAPTGHVLTGAGASVAREASIVKQGTYSAKLTRAGTDCHIGESITDYLSYVGRRVTFGRWVYATVANRAFIGIYDGVNANLSAAHTGSGTWEFLTVTADIAATATQLTARNHCMNGNTSVYFDNGVLNDGDTGIFDLSPYVEAWKPQGRYRVEQYNVARRDGKIIPDFNFDDKGINIDGIVVSNSVSSTRTTMDSILRAINPQRYRPDGRILRHDIYLYDDRILKVLLGGLDVDPSAALRAMRFRLKMQGVDPFYRAIQKTRQSVSLSASPTTFTVTTVGNIYTMPIFQFTPAGSNMTACVLENLTTGESLSFPATVLIADILKIDSDLKTVENDGVDSLGDFVGDFLRLVPGNNVIKFTGTTGGTLLIDWYEKYLFG